MKPKGAKRRKIPEHYIETLIALDQCERTSQAADSLYITYDGMHKRIQRMNDWFGDVAILNGKYRKPELTDTAYRLLELYQLDYSDAEILEILGVS